MNDHQENHSFLKIISVICNCHWVTEYNIVPSHFSNTQNTIDLFKAARLEKDASTSTEEKRLVNLSLFFLFLDECEKIEPDTINKDGCIFGFCHIMGYSQDIVKAKMSYVYHHDEITNNVSTELYLEREPLDLKYLVYFNRIAPTFEWFIYNYMLCPLYKHINLQCKRCNLKNTKSEQKQDKIQATEKGMEQEPKSKAAEKEALVWQIIREHNNKSFNQALKKAQKPLFSAFANNPITDSLCDNYFYYYANSPHLLQVLIAIEAATQWAQAYPDNFFSRSSIQGYDTKIKNECLSILDELYVNLDRIGRAFSKTGKLEFLDALKQRRSYINVCDETRLYMPYGDIETREFLAREANRFAIEFADPVITYINNDTLWKMTSSCKINYLLHYAYTELEESDKLKSIKEGVLRIIELYKLMMESNPMQQVDERAKELKSTNKKLKAIKADPLSTELFDSRICPYSQNGCLTSVYEDDMLIQVRMYMLKLTKRWLLKAMSSECWDECMKMIDLGDSKIIQLIIKDMTISKTAVENEQLR